VDQDLHEPRLAPHVLKRGSVRTWLDISTLTVFAGVLGGVGFALLNAVVIAAASGTLPGANEKGEAL